MAGAGLEAAVASNYRDRLRRLAVTMPGLELGSIPMTPGRRGLDQKAIALTRLAALIAVGGAGPSFSEHADAAVSAGASADEIVDVLVAVGDVVGAPRVVAAAPKLALALGYDLDDALE